MDPDPATSSPSDVDEGRPASPQPTSAQPESPERGPGSPPPAPPPAESPSPPSGPSWSPPPAAGSSSGWSAPPDGPSGGAPGSGWGAQAAPSWPAPAPTRSVWPIVAAGLGGLVVGGLLALVVTGVLFGLAAGSFGPAEAYGPRSAAAGAEPGECFDDLDLTSPGARSVPCDRPHVVEVYVRRPAMDGDDLPYPDGEALDTLADSMCFAEFEPYVGTPYEESELLYLAHVPDADAWAAGERDVLCSIDVEGESLEGSVEGSRR